MKQKPGGQLDTQPVDLLLPFGGGWDIMGVDEAHVNANVKSKICNAHAMLSQSCALRIMMTGTACVNKPSDMAGIAKAGNAVSQMPNIDYQSVKSWVIPKASRDTVNRENVRLFRDEFVDRHKLDVRKMMLPSISARVGELQCVSQEQRRRGVHGNYRECLQPVSSHGSSS